MVADGAQTSEVPLRKSGRVFYGWWIALATALLSSINGGFYYYGFSAYFISLEQQFGWSRVTLSGAISLSRLEGGIVGPIAGYLVDRFGPRRIMAVGVLAMGAGFILLSRVDSIVSFYLVFVLLIAVGASLGIGGPPMITTAKWFVRRRGLAIGLAMSGFGFGGFFLPIVVWMISSFGWQFALIASGLIVWAVGLPIIAVMRHKPERYGLLPDGLTLTPPEKDQNTPTGLQGAADGVQLAAAEQNFTVAQALRSPVFWLMALALGLRQLVVSAVTIHQIPFLVGLGISQEFAAMALGSIAVVSVAGRLGFGWLGDRFEKRKTMAFSAFLVAIGCLILAVMNSWWQLIPFVLVYAPAYGGGASLMLAMRGEYFGRESFGTISGLMDFIQMFGLVLGPIFAGYVFESTGSYRAAFFIFTAFATIAAIFMLFLRKPTLKTSQSSALRGH